jgi:hypothetical protein
MASEQKANWPDRTIDQRAWELAKIAVGTDDIHRLVERANEIKKALLKGEL